jgi:hypothetical protein
LIKFGAKIVRHGRYVALQMAEVAIPRQMFEEILRLIAELQPPTTLTLDIRRSWIPEQSKGQEQTKEGVKCKGKWPDRTLKCHSNAWNGNS